MIAAIAATLLALISGSAIVAALPSAERRLDFLFFSEAYLLGIAAEAGVLFVFALTGVRWSLAAAIAGLAVVTLGAAFVAYRRHDRWTIARPALSPIDAVTALMVAGYLRYATLAPPVVIDYEGIWGLKSRRFLVAGGIDWHFLTQSFNKWAHPDYPVLVPLIYDFQWLLGRGWDDRWAGAVAAGFGLAALLALRSLLAAEDRGQFIPLATLLLMPAVFSPFIAIAESQLLTYGTVALLLIRRGLRRGDHREITRAAVYLGLAASSKNEGIALIIAAALALVAVSSFRYVYRLWPALAIPLPWAIVQHVRHLQVDFIRGGLLERLLAHLSNPMPMFQAMQQNPAGRLPLWLGLILAFALGVRRIASEERFLSLAMLFQLLAILAAYALTPYDLAWHVRWSWERVVLQLAPAMMFLALVLVARDLPPWLRQPAPGSPGN